ncbi:lamin tail domain-containing protein [Humibacter soli]
MAIAAVASGTFTAVAAHAAPSGSGEIRITELAYGGKISSSTGDGEYVELTNIGSGTQSFAGWTYTGKPGTAPLALDDFGTLAPGESAIITDVTPGEFRTEWSLPNSLKIIDDSANGNSTTLDKGPDTPTVYDGTGTVVDSVSYAAGFFSGKGVSAWPDAAALGAKSGTAGWNISTVGDAEGSRTSASGAVGSPGVTSYGTRTADIRITELAYGGLMSNASGDGEYVELTNVGTAPQNFTGWTYTGKSGSGTLPLDAFGSVAPGQSVIITDVDPASFRTEWNLPDSVEIVQDDANGSKVTLDKGPDTPTVYDATGAVVDSVAYAAGYFPGKGYSAWPDSAHVGAKGDTTGWTISTAGDAENSATSASGAVGSPGSYVSAAAGASTGGGTPGGGNPDGQPFPGPAGTEANASTYNFGQNLSGLFYVAGATSSQDYMWGVENGDSGAPLNTGGSTLWKLTQDQNGKWSPADSSWDSGVRLHYPDGSGQPDSEGVTAVGGQVFVSTERDNDNNGVSRTSILQYDPSAISGGSWNATREWNLEPDFNLPTADANLGLEAVTFVPDKYLVANGFKTDAGALYDPSAYGDHFGGVFFAGLEANGNIYAYVLQADGGFHRLAEFSSGFNQIMDATWDPAQDALWLDCDNGCQEQTSIVKLDTTKGDPNQGHFELDKIYNAPDGMATTLNNEGFTLQPASECDSTTNTRSAWWSDDNNDSNIALRTAKVNCVTPIPGQVGATVSVAYTQQGKAAPAVTNGAGAYTTPLTAHFTCTDVDAVLNQACPAAVDITTSQPATTVETLTDTLGKVYQAQIPAITIASGTTTTPSSATLSLSAGSGKVGDMITVSGTNFTPGDQVSFEFHSTPVDLGTAKAGSDGTVTFSFAVPQVDPGAHSITASINGDVVSSAAFTVAAASNTASSSTQADALASTGSVISLTAIIAAVALLVAGFVFLMLRRRKTDKVTEI